MHWVVERGRCGGIDFLGVRFVLMAVWFGEGHESSPPDSSLRFRTALLPPSVCQQDLELRACIAV